MNGATTVYQLIAGASAVTALVPVDQIVTGILPQGTPLPAISIGEVSESDLETIAPGAYRMTTERIQVTVMARNYDALTAAMKQVKSACDAKSPAVSGIENVIVRTLSKGPYFTNDEASIHMRTQDFRVSYVQPA